MTKVEIRVSPSPWARCPQPQVSVHGGRPGDAYRLAAAFVDRMGIDIWCAMPSMGGGGGGFSIETSEGSREEAERAVRIIGTACADFGWSCSVSWEMPAPEASKA